MQFQDKDTLPLRASLYSPSCISLKPKTSASRKVVGDCLESVSDAVIQSPCPYPIPLRDGGFVNEENDAVNLMVPCSSHG